MLAWLPGISEKAPKIYNIVSKSILQAKHFSPANFQKKKYSSVEIKGLIKTHIIQFSNGKIKYFTREFYECQISEKVR